MDRTYLAIKWQHDLSDEPVLLYSELDHDRRELWEVDVYRRSSLAVKSPR